MYKTRISAACENLLSFSDSCTGRHRLPVRCSQPAFAYWLGV